MASTTFVDNQTIIYASWLNDVNSLTYSGQLIGGVLNSSTFAIQTGGINAITIDASQNVTINNLVLAGTLSAAGLSLTGNLTTTGTVSATGTVSSTAGFSTTAGTVSSYKYVSTSGIYENANTVTQNYTIASGNNGLSGGPVSLASGVTVTVPSGSRWAIA